MSRKPSHMVMSAKRPSPRQRIWEKIRAHAEWTILEIAEATGVERETVISYVRSLEAGAYIKRIGERPVTACLHRKTVTKFNHLVFTLVNNVGVEAPRLTKEGKPVIQGLAQEQMWRTMKRLPRFNHVELAIAASTEAVAVAEAAAKDYCLNLARAGYLDVLSKGKGGQGPKGAPSVYRFNRARDTGPKAPQIQRMKTVFDGNLREIVWHSEVDE